MIQGVGQGGGFARAAIDAALKSLEQKAGAIEREAGHGLAGSAGLQKSGAAQPSFESTLSKGLEQANDAVKQVEDLPLEMLTGKVSDFHEVAGQLKQAELVFKFSLEVRNKLIDAYRETMRMSV